MKEIFIKDDNYIQISGWMLNELDLKGNELLIYALIHGFSQDGKSDYHGGLTYIALWTNSTKQGVIKALKSLLEKGLIQKKIFTENGLQYARYWTVKSRINPKQLKSDKQSFSTNQSTEFTPKQNESGKHSLPNQSTEFNSGSQQSLPNNININSLNTTSSVSTEKPLQNNKKEPEEEGDLITKELKKIFEGHFVFDDNFVPLLKDISKEFELNETQLLVYLHYVLERVRDKNPKSLTNMYYKYAKSKNIMQDFVLSVHEKDMKEKENTTVCPVCGNEVHYFTECSCCGLYINTTYEQKDIEIKKQIFNLSDSKKQMFNKEFEAELERQSSYDLMERLGNKKLKKEFEERIEAIYKKYGITA